MGLRATIAGAVVAAVVAVGVVAAPANAAEYPSYDDVVAARNNESAKQEQIAGIQAAIESTRQVVAAAQQLAAQRGAEYQQAQEAFDKADATARQLEEDSTAKLEAADKATKRAAVLAAQVYRSGNSDPQLEMFLGSGGDGSATDDFLARLGRVDQLTDVGNDIYAAALVARNEADSLSDQAEVARTAREELRVAAEAKLQEAVDAQIQAQAALEQQEVENAQLETQLAILESNTATTEAQYAEGVRERERQERLAIERERQRQQAIRDAQNNSGGGSSGGGGGGGGGGGTVSGGWVRPSSGPITSYYGYRDSPTAGATSYHRGIDFGASCGSANRAAASGVVTYAGSFGSYGNFVMISHGGGIVTAYAHMQNGGLRVSVGDSVSAGQTVGLVGTTGTSTGCHLHFEVRQNGTQIDPLPFLRNRGVGV